MARRLDPTFVLSLDKELIWGSFDHTSDRDFAAQNPDLRGVLTELLATLDSYEIASTWALVGHLFLQSCERGTDGLAHPEIVRPEHKWYAGDWLDRDPCTNRESDPLWYGDDILSDILAAKVKHEVASHSFTHMVYGDPGCSVSAAESDLRACVRAAEARGVRLKSFVFPRNVEGHHQLLAKYGFCAYRGEDPVWYRHSRGSAKRAIHLLDQALAVAPPVSVPVQTLPGLWNIPGSMLLLHRGGVRRIVSVDATIEKARKGLRRAVEQRAVFHLWFHPFNLTQHRALMFAALRGILAEVAALRARGMIECRTMAQVAEQMQLG
jgi:peptidoglycan/xylan/chitin deacetylase (PgdA/CDA1 family)